jgi:hypothetical protein
MSSLERYAPLSAFLFTIFVVAAFILTGETPSVGDPATEVVDYYKDNVTETWFAAALITLGAVSLVWFGAVLRSHIMVSEGGNGRIASLVFAATVLMATGITIFAGAGASAAEAADEERSADIVETLNVLNNDMFFTVAGGTLLLYAALTVAILRHGAFPRGLGFVTLIATVACLTPAGFFMFLLSLLLLPVLAVMIYRGRAPADPGPQAVTTA